MHVCASAASNGATAPDLVLVCVPDSAIREVARGIVPGPWVAHVSGATPLAALAPHVRRFGLHPLQTFNRSGSGDQLDGAWAAVTAECDEAAQARPVAGRAPGSEALRNPRRGPNAVSRGRRDRVQLPGHAVSVREAAARIRRRAAGSARPAHAPRTIDNGFDLTGPIARGDWATIDAHLAAIHDAAPELERMYRALAEVTAP